MNKIYFLKNKAYNKEILKHISDFQFNIEKKQNSKAFAKQYSSALAKTVALVLGAELTAKKIDMLGFSKAENGKPYFENATDLKFNISHSSDMIAVAFSENEIGIDIEKFYRPNLKIAKRYFTKNENDYINRSVFGKSYRFFEVWTKKEAYLKKNGTGITVALNSFDVTTDEISKNIKTFKYKNFIVSVCGNVNNFEIIQLKETEILKKLKTQALIN